MKYKQADGMGFFGENDEGVIIEGTITRKQYEKIKNFKDFKLILDDQGSGAERRLLNINNPVKDYVFAGFDIKEGDVVIDIGAHIGQVSIYAAVHGKAVYSFEPDPRNIEKCARNH